MREALARSDVTAVRRSSAPVHNRASRTASPHKAPKATTSSAMQIPRRMIAGVLSSIAFVIMLAARLLLITMQRWPIAVFGGLLGSGLAIAIIINAVTLQEGKHPSPMFENGQLRTSIVPIAKTGSLPPPRPQKVAPILQTAAAPAPHHTEAPKAVTAPAPIQAQAVIDDPIAHLITNGAPPAQQVKTVQNDIFLVQQALVKLGYTITPDGRAGPATQQAITAFEKLEALPITGDPKSAAMRRALAVASGMAL